ncbi:hypothetical protein O181_106052 [Austropuccinia psidii MF-1]|uniref:Uncharacterized protein n=1 Tax=Austropuccinia psidii MF-1 TaxID=1389203 RepID=A0A9Q3JPP4_9BASI|nr:hypothetical protein [Austropuccinia psidii MF-1]
MNSQGRLYGSGYSDLINIFSTEEVEELLFGYPSSPSNSTTFWDWVNGPSYTPPSPPALSPISIASSPSSYSGEVPEAAMAFYAFIEGAYDPRLFVPDPFNYFSEERASSAIKPKRHPYFLRPRDSNGRAITAPKLN